LSDLSDFIARTRKQLTPILNRSGSILYSAQSTLRPGKLYLLGLNPGGDPTRHHTIGEDLDKLPLRNVNAYVHESWERQRQAGGAPLQQRVRWLMGRLGQNVENVCASNLIFARSRDASRSDYPQLAHLCWPVHLAMLEIVRPRLIIAYGNSKVSPYAYLRSQLSSSPEEVFNSGHGTWKCRVFRSASHWIVGLPHLSRYAIHHHPDVADRLRRLLAA
jgi:hypothetical protein